LIECAEHTCPEGFSREQTWRIGLERAGPCIGTNVFTGVCGSGCLHRIQRRAAAAWPRPWGRFAAALASMVARLTIGEKRYVRARRR